MNLNKVLLNKTKLIIIRKILNDKLKIRKLSENITNDSLNFVNAKNLFKKPFWIVNRSDRRKSYIVT